MKTLLLLRHGKSSWSDDHIEDHERPLKKRGRRAATRIGAELKRLDVVPDRVVSSTARRALHTAELCAEACGFSGTIESTRALYATGTARYLEAVATGTDDAIEMVMLVGHNPELEELTGVLVGQDVRLTTANVACVDFDVDRWADVPKCRGRLRFVLRPRDLEE